MKDVAVIVALPHDAVAPTVLSENIEYITVGKHTGTRWEQFDLPKFCKKQKLPLLCGGNMGPIFYKSHIVLHDVFYRDFGHYSLKKSWVIKTNIMVRTYIYRNNNIFTVSNFSRDRICHLYPKIKKEPIVVGNGHEHTYEWKEQHVDNLPASFYLSVGSVSPHKNFKFVLALAKQHPMLSFVIAGKKNIEYDNFLDENNITNCYFTGYMNDGQLAYLYRRCEGFILPSLYEGFGIPPLEAVACGCRKIFLSDIPVFHEIYGDSAIYFNPHGTDIPFNASAMSEEKAVGLLEKYSWKKAAEKIIAAMFS